MAGPEITRLLEGGDRGKFEILTLMYISDTVLHDLMCFKLCCDLMEKLLAMVPPPRPLDVPEVRQHVKEVLGQVQFRLTHHLFIEHLFSDRRTPPEMPRSERWAPYDAHAWDMFLKGMSDILRPAVEDWLVLVKALEAILAEYPVGKPTERDSDLAEVVFEMGTRCRNVRAGLEPEFWEALVVERDVARRAGRE